MANDNDLSLIAFRLNAVEVKLEETAIATLDKLEQLLNQQADLGTTIATERQAREFLTADVKRIEDDFKSHKKLSHGRYEDQQKLNTEFQVTLAQKVIPGAVTGGLVTILIMLVKFLVGAP